MMLLAPSKSMEREQDIQRAILTYLCAQFPRGKWWVNKTVGTAGRARRQGTTYRGAGDILGCYKGQHIEFEVKARKGVQSEWQKRHEQDIKAAGGRYFVVHSVDEVREAME